MNEYSRQAFREHLATLPQAISYCGDDLRCPIIKYIDGGNNLLLAFSTDSELTVAIDDFCIDKLTDWGCLTPADLIGLIDGLDTRVVRLSIP